MIVEEGIVWIVGRGRKAGGLIGHGSEDRKISYDHRDNNDSLAVKDNWVRKD